MLPKKKTVMWSFVSVHNSHFVIEETTPSVNFLKILILYALFLFYLSKYQFSNFFSLYLTMVNRLYTLINKLYIIINKFYIIINNLYTKINKLFTKKKKIFWLIFLKIKLNLNENLKLPFYHLAMRTPSCFGLREKSMSIFKAQTSNSTPK